MKLDAAYIGLGSNQGDRLEKLSEAIYLLDTTPGIGVAKISGAYESSPQNMPPGSRNFLNAVVKFEAAMPPIDLLATCLGIERLMGRDRSWAVQDRPIDLDLLYYEGAAIRTLELVLPHPRAHIRTFVLMPWIEIEPGFSLYGATLEDWLTMIPPEDHVSCAHYGAIPAYSSLG